AQADELKEFQEVRFLKNRFGSDSGSPIVIQVQENNDERRTKTLEKLAELMQQHHALSNIEIEKPVTRPEYKLELLERKTAQLNVDFSQLDSTLRAFVEGQILYTLNTGEEEVDIRLMSDDKYKKNIEDVMSLRVANND